MPPQCETQSCISDLLQVRSFATLSDHRANVQWSMAISGSSVYTKSNGYN